MPRIGLRARLASVGKGKWQNTGGEKSKFGLTASQIQAVVTRLTEADAWEACSSCTSTCSQIANIHDIQRGLRECARFYQNLLAMGAPVDTVDVGGGLGIDYEGTRSRSFCSINYSMREYARNVVSAFSQVCASEGLPHPHLLSESGRALTAHHAVLITNVIGEERPDTQAPETRCHAGDPQVAELWRVHDELHALHDPRGLVEAWHDLTQALGELQDRFVMGLADLGARAEGEGVHSAACARLRERLDPRNRAHREIHDELAEKLADKLFVNFSLFQSVPDVWGIDQIFPVLPLSGLDREPSRRAVIQDITCDSDGRIDGYVDGQGVESTLPLPEWRDDEERLMGFFLVGAYQEILGDLHNLFGDTDSVDASLDADGQWHFDHLLRGDRVATCSGTSTSMPMPCAHGSMSNSPPAT